MGWCSMLETAGSESEPTTPTGQDVPIGLPVAGTPKTPALSGALHAPSDAQEAWFSAYRDPKVRDFLKERGFSSAEDALASFHTLNERVGDGRDFIRLPQDGRMTRDARRAIYRRLGAPETPDGYDLQIPKERASDRHLSGFREDARSVFAEHDVPQDLAQALFASVLQSDAEYAQKLATELREENDHNVERLKSEYGQDFSSFISRGKRAVQALGLDADTLTALEGSMNLASTMKLLAAIGSRLGEGQPQLGTFTGDQNQGIPVASLPEQAQLEIDRRTKDDAFMQMVYDETHPGHDRASQRYLELHAML